MLRKGWASWQKAGKLMGVAVSAVLIGVAGLSANPVQARDFLAPFVLTPTISAAQLPPQGRSMLTLIYQGGPFRHDKDGVVFGNRERLLPAAGTRAYYREYTVRTPGVRSRGARRIVCGGLQPAAPDACFYTDDHYASFRKIVH